MRIQFIDIGGVATILSAVVAVLLQIFEARRARSRTAGERRATRGLTARTVASLAFGLIAVVFSTAVSILYILTLTPDWPGIINLMAALGSAIAAGIGFAIEVRAEFFTGRSEKRAGRRGSAEPRLWIVAVAFAVALGVTAFAVRVGVARLAVRDSSATAADALLQLLAVSAGSGVLAFAVVEFVKRQSQLRTHFNRRAVTTSFPDLESVSRQVTRMSRADREAGLLTSLGPLVYTADLQQLSAQLAQNIRVLLRAAVALTDPVYVGAVRSILGDGLTVDPDRLDDLDEIVERRLDTFQLESLARWRSLLRTASSGASAVLAGMLAWAVSADILSILVAALLGLVVGGPVAWIVRDVTRVIERRASF